LERGGGGGGGKKNKYTSVNPAFEKQNVPLEFD